VLDFRGRIQDFGLGGALAGEKPEECYIMRLKKTTYREKNNKSTQTDIV